MQFSRASVVDFILRDRDLGKDPLQIQLWHDNSGKGENVAELPKSIDKRACDANFRQHARCERLISLELEVGLCVYIF